MLKIGIGMSMMLTMINFWAIIDFADKDNVEEISDDHFYQELRIQ